MNYTVSNAICNTIYSNYTVQYTVTLLFGVIFYVILIHNFMDRRISNSIQTIKLQYK